MELGGLKREEERREGEFGFDATREGPNGPQAELIC